jgi:chaperone required for assembly of F1-ATPase
MSEAGNPMRAAQANMRQPEIKRFYRAAEVQERDGAYTLALDGRLARSPGRNPLASGNRALLERIAEEWRRQGETLDLSDMPLTRLLNAAIDGVSRTMAETRAVTGAYADSDLLCYRAEEPEALAERQRQAFDRLLDWAAESLNARFNLAAGVIHVAQPPEALAAVQGALEAVEDPARLAAISTITALTGSVLIALAVAEGRLSPEDAWRAAHVDEDFQAERWGVDEEALARRKARWREMEAAGLLLSATRARPARG